MLLAAAVLIGGSAFAASAQAQVFNPFDTCHVCQPVVPVVVDPCATCVQTTLVPQHQVTYQNVTETRYRQETVATQVPVTRYRQVTRDEGGYQTVWVPKMVTRNVPETVYEQRLTTRSVPYSVTTQIPQVRTVYTPQTTVYNPWGTPIVSQPVQLSAPVPQVQPYQPREANSNNSKLPPSNPKALDLKELDTAKPTYDDRTQSSIGSGQRGKYIKTSASVFRLATRN
jgi:hypothetical protein